MIKYIGELYNYRMVESSIVFKTLYLLITYGVSFDRTVFIFMFIPFSLLIKWEYSLFNEANETNNPESLDPADNMNRVKFVCTLLDTCGQYFDRGSTKKKLDCYLIYFQVSRNLFYFF